jgi:hypothetical protein
MNRPVFTGSFDMADLQTNWSYEPSAIAARIRLKRTRAWLTGRRAPPSFRIIRAPSAAGRWNVLFLFAPTGELDGDQRQILQRVQSLEGPVLVVLAVPTSAASAAAAALHRVDALIVKELEGYDFSAYRIALDLIALHSPGATAYVQNDSVLGPFGEADELVRRAPWDLTGIIGMRAVENHVSSFAFILRSVTPARVAALRPVLSPSWGCDRFDDVIMLQETRLARIASRSMSVGAYWYVPTQPGLNPLLVSLGRRVMRVPPLADISADATLASPVDLLNAGFPYLKRSLFTKFAGLHDPTKLMKALEVRGWETDDIKWLVTSS